MSIDRRKFFQNLGVGSLIFGTQGIFKIDEKQEITPVHQDEVLRIAGAILDALDGKATDTNIYDFVRASLTKGTIYETDGIYTVVDSEASIDYKKGKRKV